MYEVILEEQDRIQRLGWFTNKKEAQLKRDKYMEKRGWMEEYEVRIEEKE